VSRNREEPPTPALGDLADALGAPRSEGTWIYCRHLELLPRRYGFNRQFQNARMVTPSIRFCMMRWLPLWRTAANPFRSRTPANLGPRKDAKPTLQGPASRRSHCGNAAQLQMGRLSRRTKTVPLSDSRASSIVEPWLATSSSGQRDTNPSSSRSIMAVRRREWFIISVYNSIGCFAFF
jgi:hypothetical protein